MHRTYDLPFAASRSSIMVSVIGASVSDDAPGCEFVPDPRDPGRIVAVRIDRSQFETVRVETTYREDYRTFVAIRAWVCGGERRDAAPDVEITYRAGAKP